MNNKFKITCEYSQIVNLFMYQNHIPVINKITIKNISQYDLNNINISITTEPKFSCQWNTKIKNIKAHEEFEINTINIDLFANYLYNVTTHIKGNIFINIMQDTQLIQSITKCISILAYNQWSGILYMPEIIASFSTPNNPSIDAIIKNANKILQNGDSNFSFLGYQSNNRDIVMKQMEAIYEALKQENISYCMSLESYERIEQSVRLCNDVLSQKSGTSLDLSLLYASCLEFIHLNPLIIFMKGYTFVGCWIEDKCLDECVEYNFSSLTKKNQEGLNEICVVETACLSKNTNYSFEEAIKNAENNFLNKADFLLLIDIKATRKSGIKSIPQKVVNKVNQLCFQETQKKFDKDYNLQTQRFKEFELNDKITEPVNLNKQQIWERNLLDLTMKNQLLNFKTNKNSIQLMVNNLSDFKDGISSGNEFKVMSFPKDFQDKLCDIKIYEMENKNFAIDDLIETEFKNKRIRTFTNEDETNYRIKNIYYNSKVSLEENGVNILYLALGFLKWYESDISQKVRYSPLILCPIEIIYNPINKDYIIHAIDEETKINAILLEMLRTTFGIDIVDLENISIHKNSIDIKKTFNIVKQIVIHKPRWDIEEAAFIGMFPFSQYIMWDNIKNHSKELKNHKIIDSLISGKVKWLAKNNYCTPEKLDNDISPLDIITPISADSSQIDAIYAAVNGESFVLHGAPGTGKSQTITNIIANMLFQGKSVLFVAKKRTALSVVQKRLESIGLDTFSLELHSNKENKNDIIEQLNNVLNIGKTKSPEQYNKQANKLYFLRKNLNNIIDKIHQKHKFGFSLYECISTIEQYDKYTQTFKFSNEQIDYIDNQRYKVWEELCKQTQITANSCENVKDHFLLEFRNKDYSQNKKDIIIQKLNQYKILNRSIKKFIDDIEITLQLNKTKTIDEINSIFEFCKFVGNTKYISLELFKNPEIGSLSTKIEQMCRSGKKRDELENILFKQFYKSVLKFNEQEAKRNWISAGKRWFIPRIFKQNKIAKKLKLFFKLPKNFDKAKVLDYIDILEEYKENISFINKNKKQFSKFYRVFWNDSKCDWGNIKQIYYDTLKMISLVSRLCKNNENKYNIMNSLGENILIDFSKFKEENHLKFEPVSNAILNIKQLEKDINKLCGIDFVQLNKSDNWLDFMFDKVELWCANIDKLQNWCMYLDIREKMVKQELGTIIDVLENTEFDYNNILPTFYKSLFQAFALDIIKNDTELLNFNGALYEEEIDKYKSVCKEFENLTKDELIARLSLQASAIATNPIYSSEIEFLHKTIKSDEKIMSIRNLFNNIPNLLRKLCPCMIMSPTTVTQYIDFKYPDFDLVIFDEASQIPTCEAIGVIAKGNNLVVVGDQNQLPPTNFFSHNYLNEDDFNKEDLKSILDDSLAICMPQKHLLWHYRSKHESLIKFSNNQYYNNDLYTFPSPKNLKSAIKYIEVNGYYNREKTKQNKAEAQAIVNEIIKRLKDPVLSKSSIGVVAFSYIQQNLIDTILKEEFLKNPTLEVVSNNMEEPIFIKNIENVQGYERDVIMLSIGYGSDKEKNVALNFGLLNHNNGWKYLNVATSRAREEMLVFSVIKPEQIDLLKTHSDGIVGLKAFLEFSINGDMSNLAMKDNKINNDFEVIVAEKIKNMGFEVNTNIGCSDYKISIGIINPNNPEEYILGIICDNEQYKNAGTSKDRNILQNDVLKSLGWNIYNIWILDWWENSVKELEKIKNKIESLIENDKAIQNYEYEVASTYASEETSLTMENFKENKEELLIKYNICILEPVIGGIDVFYHNSSNSIIASQIKEIIKAEAPINYNLLCKRILNSWGISKIGIKIEKRISHLISDLNIVKYEFGDNIFYYNDEDNIKFRIPSSDETKRNIIDISPQEISLAMKHIIKMNISLSCNDLFKETARLFGFGRCTSSMAVYLNKCLEYSIKQEVFLFNDERIIQK